LKTEGEQAHDSFEITRSGLEADWELNDIRRAERASEIQRRREERKKLQYEHLEAKKGTYQNLAQNQEEEETRAEEWALIYELNSQPENIHLPQAVQDHILCNILEDIDDNGTDEEDQDLHETRRRRKENAIPRDRDIDREVREAKRDIAEKVLSRAKQRTRTIQ